MSPRSERRLVGGSFGRSAGFQPALVARMPSGLREVRYSHGVGPHQHLRLLSSGEPRAADRLKSKFH